MKTEGVNWKRKVKRRKREQNRFRKRFEIVRERDISFHDRNE